MKIVVKVKGSDKSGNFGHAGIPGSVGGSAPSLGGWSIIGTEYPPEVTSILKDNYTVIIKKFPNLPNRLDRVRAISAENPPFSKIIISKSSDGKNRGSADRQIKLYYGEDISSNPLTIGEGAQNVHGSSLSGSYRHELGHVIYQSLDRNEKREWRRLLITSLGFKDTGRGYAGSIKVTARKLSRVGSMNDEEALAEVFAAMSHPNYSTNALPEDIERFMQSL